MIEIKDGIGLTAAFSIIFPRKRLRGRGFTLIELVIASLLGAMVIMGAFVILLTFRQQARMAWAERAMDQYMYMATRHLTELFSSALDYRNLGVAQNNYAVWDVTHGDLTNSQVPPTHIGISGNRTNGLLINNQRFDLNFPPVVRPSSRHGVPMWDRRDSFELLYLGINHPTESLADSSRQFVEGTQIVLTMRMRYRHLDRSSFGLLFGRDYARTRTYQTRVFLRNLTVENAWRDLTNPGPSPPGGGSGTLGWSLASGKSADEYLTEKWQQQQSRIRPVRLQ